MDRPDVRASDAKRDGVVERLRDAAAAPVEHSSVSDAQRSERRPSERLLAELDELRRLATVLDVESPAEDLDVGLTTDDMLS
jgi:hypothetical protein